MVIPENSPVVHNMPPLSLKSICLQESKSFDLIHGLAIQIQYRNYKADIIVNHKNTK